MILDRYIGKTIIGTILIVLSVLAAVQIFIEFTREFSDMGTGYYGFVQVLQYVPLMLPQDLYQLFPMAGLLGSLVGLGVLSSNSELIVMRASGVSLFAITRSVLKAALLLTFIMILMGEVLAPFAQQKAVANKTTAMSGGQVLVTSQGIWLHNLDNFVHIDTVAPDGRLQSILRYQFDKNGRLKVASFASEGIYDENGWLFKSVTETEFQENKTTTNNFPEQRWNLSLKRHLIGLTNIDTEQKSLPQIYKYIKDRQKNGLNVDRYQFTFWQRALAPLAILVMILLSVPVILGFLRAKAMGMRIVVGAVLGFTFYVMTQFVGHFTMVYNIPAFIAAFLPIFLFTLLGCLLLSKIK